MVRCWTNQVIHFGMQSTLRVEGYHRSLKRWINSSGVDLLTIYHRLEGWWELSLQAHEGAISDSFVRARVDLDRPLFSRVRLTIHNYALSQCLVQLSIIPKSACSGMFSRTTGLPCVHKLLVLKRGGISLMPSDFHVHWWIDRVQGPVPPPAQALEPATTAQRRTEAASRKRAASHKRGAGPRGTLRIPSAFEQTEGERLPPLASKTHTELLSFKCREGLQ